MNIRRQSNTFHFEEYPFSKNAKGISKIYHEVLFLIKFLHTKPHVKIKNNNYDLYYIIKNRADKDVVNEYENDTDYLNFEDFIIPNHHVGIKPRETIFS